MAIHDELNEITLQLAQLEKQKQQLLERQRDLEHQLQGSRQTEDQTKLQSQQEQTSSFSAHERLIIFSTLFKGRDDVFATRWDNAKTGRSGYSQACANEWKKGVCFKPQVKCTDCNAQQFKPLDLNQLYQHLTGQQTIGLCNSVNKSTSLELVFLFAAIHGAHPVGPTLLVAQNCSGKFWILKIRWSDDDSLVGCLYSFTYFCFF